MSKKAPVIAVPSRRRPKVDPAAAAAFEAGEPAPKRATKRKAKGDQAPNRRGSASAPHTRKDGVKTRAVTLHLPVDLAKRLRVEAAEEGVSMSRLVAQRLQLS